MNREKIVQIVKNLDIPKIKVAVPDIDGILRGKYMHRDKFLEAIEHDFGFCDVIFGWDSGDACYDNTDATGWHTGYPDAKASIDWSTFRRIPWEHSVPFFIADFDKDAKYRSVACPRSLLKKIRNEADALGFKAVFSQEFEWFTFRNSPSELNASGFQDIQPLSPGMFGYSVLRSSLNNPYFSDLFDLTGKFDIPLEGLHTETGPGAFEATIVYDEILSAADKALLFKTAVKEIAYKHGYTASFMAKWNAKLPGCGGHIHQSLWDKEGTRNLFFDASAKKGISSIMEQYMAGLLTCLPEILPVFAPNVNSYKRIGHGDWAPATLTWGIDNRTTALRIIRGESRSTRIELRVPGADMNPYLAMAGSLAAGLYGIKNNLKLRIKESTGNGYNDKQNGTFPGTLTLATQKMADSKIARELLGDAFTDHFTKTREWEYRQFDNEVTDWELKRYLEII